MTLIAVISQPMFLPWIGLFEQMRLSDIFIHYDDVQLPRGRSFMSRVQIKTPCGVQWLSAPIDRKRSGNLIRETFYLPSKDWRDQHLRTLTRCYARAPFFDSMFALATDIYEFPSNNLAAFNINALEYLCAWLGLRTKFMCSSELNICGASSQRLVDLCQHVHADTYVTGLGALKYLDYSKFESKRIFVNYMAYQKKPYPQLHGEFTPYVSILDAIANCGKQVSSLICSSSTYWREFHEQLR